MGRWGVGVGGQLALAPHLPLLPPYPPLAGVERAEKRVWVEGEERWEGGGHHQCRPLLLLPLE